MALCIFAIPHILSENRFSIIGFCSNAKAIGHGNGCAMGPCDDAPDARIHEQQHKTAVAAKQRGQKCHANQIIILNAPSERKPRRRKRPNVSRPKLKNQRPERQLPATPGPGPRIGRNSRYGNFDIFVFLHIPCGRLGDMPVAFSQSSVFDEIQRPVTLPGCSNSCVLHRCDTSL